MRASQSAAERRNRMKDELERITERFYQTSTGRNRKVGGLGLGLSIVYGMVRVMNGFMRIESEEGRGTTVTVSIPQQVAEENPEKPLINNKNLCVACFLMTEKYKVPQVREYYNKMIAHMENSLTSHCTVLRTGTNWNSY